MITVNGCELPEPNGRWTPQKKRAVLNAIHSGAVSHEDISRLYALSPEELELWGEQVKRHGSEGLRVTKIQEYPRIELPTP